MNLRTPLQMQLGCIWTTEFTTNLIDHL